MLTGAARDGVYAVNLKLIARGNWRNVGVIDYQIYTSGWSLYWCQNVDFILCQLRASQFIEILYTTPFVFDSDSA